MKKLILAVVLIATITLNTRTADEVQAQRRANIWDEKSDYLRADFSGEMAPTQQSSGTKANLSQADAGENAN